MVVHVPTTSKAGARSVAAKGRTVAYQYSKAEVAVPAQLPVVYAELDGGGRSSPVRELPGRS